MPRPISNTFFGVREFAEIIRKITGRNREESMRLATEIIKIMIRGLKEDGEIHFKNFCSVRIVDIEPGKINIMGKMRDKKTKKAKAFFSRAFRKDIA